MIFASLTLIGIVVATNADAQTRYGTTQKVTIGQTTTFTCPQDATTVCQQWGTNTDGSRFVIVFMKNNEGETIAIPFGVESEAYDPSQPGTYVLDEVTGIYYSCYED